jgi:hypothetical protein
MQISFLTVNKPPVEPPAPPAVPYLELELFDSRTAASTFEITTAPDNSFSYSFTKDGPKTVVPISMLTLRNFSIPAGVTKVFIHFDQPLPTKSVFVFSGTNDPRIKRVLHWADCPFSRLAFIDQSKLIEVPTALWSACTSLQAMFVRCSSFNPSEPTTIP